MESHYQYYAFISYKREDEWYAKWLQRKLEGYRLPSVLCKKNPDLPKRVKPVFLDQTDIQPRQLHDELRIKLEQSRFLIVICSPRSAKSQWVGEEIDYFIQLGRKDNVIAYIIDGEPYSRNSETECYHEVIRRNFPAADNPKEDRQLLGVNLNEAGSGSRRMKRQRAFIKVLSRLLDLSFDELWKRQRRRTVRNILIYIVLIMIFLVTVGFVWQSNQPFDVKVSLKEVTEHNEKLPDLENAVVSIYLNNEIKTDTLQNLDDIVMFTNIPAKYKNKKISLKFHAFGYEDIDTTMMSQDPFILPICRNDDYGKYYGMIKDGEGNGLADVSVQIDDFECLTDADGSYIISIPLAFQRPLQVIKVSKEGYNSWKHELLPGDNTIILSQKNKQK